MHSPSASSNHSHHAPASDSSDHSLGTADDGSGSERLATTPPRPPSAPPHTDTPTSAKLMSSTPVRQRTAQACDKCRERKTKCSGHRPVCLRCTNRGLICQYSQRETRARGPRYASPFVAPRSHTQSSATQQPAARVPRPAPTSSTTYTSPPASASRAYATPAVPQQAQQQQQRQTNSMDNLRMHQHHQTNQTPTFASSQPLPAKRQVPLFFDYTPFDINLASTSNRSPVLGRSDSGHSSFNNHDQRRHMGSDSLQYPSGGSGYGFDMNGFYPGSSSSYMSHNQGTASSSSSRCATPSNAYVNEMNDILPRSFQASPLDYSASTFWGPGTNFMEDPTVETPLNTAADFALATSTEMDWSRIGLGAGESTTMVAHQQHMQRHHPPLPMQQQQNIRLVRPSPVMPIPTQVLEDTAEEVLSAQSHHHHRQEPSLAGPYSRQGMLLSNY